MASDNDERTDLTMDIPPSRRKGVTWADVECFGIPLVLVLYSCGVLHYLFGVINVLLLAGPFMLVSLLVFAAAFVLFVGLLARVVRLCAGRRPPEKRFWLHMSVAVAGLAFFVGSFFFSLASAPALMLLRGFRTNMQRKADVPAIRAWLETVDPNDYTGQDHDLYDGDEYLQASDWPEPVKSLGPRTVVLFLDECGRLAVRLTWGGGFLGHWGLVVGAEQMRMPSPPDPDWGADYREFGRGAYVWCLL